MVYQNQSLEILPLHSFINTDQQIIPAKKNQYQSPKCFPENSTDLEHTNLMSISDNKSLKNVTFIMLNQIVILSVNQFRMTPILIMFTVLHMNNMYHKSIMIGKIVQENMGKSV